MTTTTAPPVANPTATGAAYLSARIFLVEQRVRRVVATLRENDPTRDDPLRGLHVSHERAWQLVEGTPVPPPPDEIDAAGLAEAERMADMAGTAGQPARLRLLAERFGLTPLDLEILLIALLPDLDQRYERLYGYLNDDVTRRRATVCLALRLAGVSPVCGAARARFNASAPLTAGGLITLEDLDRPFLGRSLRVPDRVAGYLLGDDTADPRLAQVCTADAEPTSTAPEPTLRDRLAVGLLGGVRLAYLREQVGGAAADLAGAALDAAGFAALRLDLAALAADQHPQEAIAALLREARLRRAGIVAGPVDALQTAPADGDGSAGEPAGGGTTAGPAARLLRRLAALPVPVLLTGRLRWDPYWSQRAPLMVDVPAIGAGERVRLWSQALILGGYAPADGLDPGRELAPYVLSPDQLRRAAESAGQRALLAGSTGVGPADVRAAVRGQNAAGLEKLARRVEPTVGWADLVLPDGPLDQLAELALRVRHRDRVLGDWRLRPGGGRGRGVLALFAGDSGTGKTMSAEVIAADLGLDLYVVDLSTVVDKYVGQTEKNLERIFTEAAEINGILLFDEADAIFGKRSEVSDAHDRYANMESAYLLQRMESFDGVAILTTNLRANLDEAFTRRLDVIVDFPVPDPAQRRALWRSCLGSGAPVADDLDLGWCAEQFELSGGAIRACAVSAGYYAAEAGTPITMAHLKRAIQREYRKLGRLVLDREFDQ